MLGRKIDTAFYQIEEAEKEEAAAEAAKIAGESAPPPVSNKPAYIIEHGL